MTETRKQFHEELDEINTDVIRLGAMASEVIEAATAALLDADLGAVETIAAHDRELDDLTHSIEDRTYQLLARQQPMAVDLRTLVTVLRVIHELERIGDLMVKIAKAARRLYPHAMEPRIRGLIDRMREQAGVQLRLAVDTFGARDAKRASAVVDMDDVMDDLQKDLFRAIFATSDTDEATIQRAVQIALVGRFFERVADHAVNVAERVAYMVTGEFSHTSQT